MTPVRVLLSARDPGSAAQVRAVTPALRAAGFDVVVVASPPAFEMLAAAGERPRRFALPDGRSHLPADANPATLLAEGDRLLATIDPDVIVTGISSLGVGIDEALLACAASRPTFALQDYPGDANAIGRAYASTYFVRDEPAAALTAGRFGVHAVPVGSIRHAAYARLDVTKLREESRQAAGAEATCAVVGFFGQPPEIPGHETAFTDLVTALARRKPEPLVILVEHPKALDQRRAHRAALATAGLRVHDASGAAAVEPWLAACDVVATCYSHCTIDHAFLNAVSAEPLGTALFVMTAPETWRFLREHGGLDTPDGVERGLGRVARTADDLGPLLDELLSDTARRAYHAVCRHLPTRAAFDIVTGLLVEAGRQRRATTSR